MAQLSALCQHSGSGLTSAHTVDYQRPLASPNTTLSADWPKALNHMNICQTQYAKLSKAKLTFAMHQLVKLTAICFWFKHIWLNYSTCQFEQQKSIPHDVQTLVEETEKSSKLEPMALMKMMKQNVGRWRSHNTAASTG